MELIFGASRSLVASTSKSQYPLTAEDMLIVTKLHISKKCRLLVRGIYRSFRVRAVRIFDSILKGEVGANGSG